MNSSRGILGGTGSKSISHVRPANSVQWAHIVLGQVAIRDNPEVACAELALAGRTRGSPQLNSFGPDLALAQSLLDLGYVDAVVDYLTECKRFWEMDRGLLDQWIRAISTGERPKLNKF